MEQDKDCLIIDRIFNGQWAWNWSNKLGVHNSSYLNEILLEISQVNVQVDNDKCIWSLDDDSTFTVGDLRRLIEDHLLPSLDTTTTWVKYLSHKVNIFMGRLKLDKLPHRLNLSLRGIEILEISCLSCCGMVESNQHIFFECEVAKGIWRIVRRWCDNSFPIFESNVHWLHWWSSWPVSREKKDRAYVIIATTLWFT
ncbi:RNA-directed DNA polymerase, eukaryota [Tanacetum coccineum]|uniref:RNA-directed DNA polymerase, eukaryota n=1 Tax=Tanacetum coccineum TaxID=301880 RepID=A0ABQ5IFD8_9ASTR